MLFKSLTFVTLMLIITALIMVFVYAPVEVTMGIVQKIFYFHVAAAWVGFMAFFVVFLMGILYLKTKNKKWDMIASVSAEIGVVFTTIVLITGPIWARSAWNTWWTWEPRLTTTLILWFIYMGYLFIRSMIQSDKKRVYASVYGIIGFVDVPIVFFSIRWWSTYLHPVVIKTDDPGMSPPMLYTLITSVIAFTFLYFLLLKLGWDIEVLRERLKKLKEESYRGF